MRSSPDRNSPRGATPRGREFALIDRYFRPLAGPGALDLTDDAALLTPPEGRDLVLSADAMVGGEHFLVDEAADLVAQKLLRTNLSDLAAKAAIPLGYLLTLAAPKETPDSWFALFAEGLARDQKAFRCPLLGGDSVATPGPFALSLTIIGTVERGRMVRRQGARIGDAIFVSGTIGDGALGLAVLKGELTDPTGALLRRYRLPEPRLGLDHAGLASAAMDVSDGLVQDLGHLCSVNGLAAEIDAALVPRSAPARRAGPEWLARCLTGGDDYELLLAVPEETTADLLARAATIGLPLTRIGAFVAGSPEVRVRGPDGTPMAFASPGWSHF